MPLNLWCLFFRYSYQDCFVASIFNILLLNFQFFYQTRQIRREFFIFFINQVAELLNYPILDMFVARARNREAQDPEIDNNFYLSLAPGWDKS